MNFVEETYKIGSFPPRWNAGKAIVIAVLAFRTTWEIQPRRLVNCDFCYGLNINRTAPHRTVTAP